MDNRQKSYMERVSEIAPTPDQFGGLTVTKIEEINRRMLTQFAEGVQFYINKISMLNAETVMFGDAPCFAKALEISAKIHADNLNETGRAMLSLYNRLVKSEVHTYTNTEKTPVSQEDKEAILSDLDQALRDGLIRESGKIEIDKSPGLKGVELSEDTLKALANLEDSAEVIKAVFPFVDQINSLIPRGRTSKAFFVAALLMTVPHVCQDEEGIYTSAYEIIDICFEDKNNPFRAALKNDAFRKDVLKAEERIDSRRRDNGDTES